MIPFDPSKLSVDIVSLKTVTMSVGGSISVVNAADSTEKKEAYTRIPVPMSVVRAFLQSTQKITKYLKPVYAALVKYEGHVVAMERHPLGTMGTLEYESIDGTMRRWIPTCQTNVADVCSSIQVATDRRWYFDGRYVFALTNADEAAAVREGTYLTADGHFRKLIATTLDLQLLSSKNPLAPLERSCLAFAATNGAFAISPPIWKDLASVGSSRSVKPEDEDDEDDDSVELQPDQVRAFDTIDAQFCVNLGFALNAGVEIGKTFGYEYVEPLQLPRLMIELHTTNLPTVAQQIKSTFDIGITFTQALAWLLGMSRNANTLDTYLMMRSLMKYLTKRGIFRRDKFKASKVFVDGCTIADVPLCDLKELLARDDTADSISSILQQARRGIRSRKAAGADLTQLGGLINED